MPNRASLALLALVALPGCGSERKEGQPPEAAPAQSAAAGPRPAAFAMCTACHSVEPGRHGLGPSLHGVVGRAAGSAPGFAYSEAMKMSGIWDEASLDRFLLAPRAVVPGTKMVFAGIRDEKKRAEVIAYLSTLK